jgi:hypothetical protein
MTQTYGINLLLSDAAPASLKSFISRQIFAVDFQNQWLRHKSTFWSFGASMALRHLKPLELNYPRAQDAYVKRGFSGVESARAESVDQLFVGKASEKIAHPSRVCDRDAIERPADSRASAVEVYTAPAHLLDEPFADESPRIPLRFSRRKD